VTRIKSVEKESRAGKKAAGNMEGSLMSRECQGPVSQKKSVGRRAFEAQSVWVGQLKEAIRAETGNCGS
jgi:hypothetical protein